MMVSLIIVKALDELESVEIKLTGHGKLLEERQLGRIGIKDMLMFGPEKLDECEFYSLKYGTWKEKQLWGQKN